MSTVGKYVVPAIVAGQQAVARHRRVRANVEIGQRRTRVTAAAPVSQKRLPGGETRQIRQRLAFVVSGGEGRPHGVPFKRNIDSAARRANDMPRLGAFPAEVS